MSRESVGVLIDRWINEPAFRAALRKDCEAAVRDSGVELDQDELAALRSIDWGLSDAQLELQIRENKFA